MIVRVTLKQTGMSFPALGKQLVYAASLAINRTLDEARVAQQESVKRNFTLRGRGGQFVLNLVTVDRRATKTELAGQVSVGARGGNLRQELGLDDRGHILAEHEAGGTFTRGAAGSDADPITRLRSMFYVPTDFLRPNTQDVIPRNLYPASLRLAPRRNVEGMLYERTRKTKAGGVRLIGSRRTFVLFERGTGRPYGIYQREGAGGGRQRDGHDDNINRLWLYVPRITLRPRLGFAPTTQGVIRDRFALNLRGFIDHAIRTSR